ncbi:unnamed protein product [Linum trigynum]|uniref:Retrotransposon gag domain-containing protein n=1 Tax=Linum trigynum TaxID=586398 RepID=A0AAV2E497_9ROSI
MGGLHARRGQPRDEEVEYEDDEGYPRDEDDDLRNIMVNIPSFIGSTNPEAYLDWERKMELIFDYNNYSERKKVQVAALEFTDYAIVWWDQVSMRRRKNRQPPIETWAEMRTVMRDRFVPSSHHREMHQALQLLRQGTKCVEDYYREMEMLMIRADLEEDRDATIARFLYGLNREIRNVVELHPYADLYDLVAIAAKVEKQQRSNVGRRFTPPQAAPRPGTPSTSNPRPAITKLEASTQATKVEAPKDKPQALVEAFNASNVMEEGIWPTNALIKEL